MQSGNLIPFSLGQNLKEAFKKVYYFLLKRIIRISTTVNELNVNVFDYDIHDIADLKQLARIKKLNSVYVLVKQKKLDKNVSINTFEKIAFEPIKFNVVNPISSFVKWVKGSLDSSVLVKIGNFSFFTKLKAIAYKDLFINVDPKVNQIAERDIKIEKKLKVYEEIIGISPYVKIMLAKKLLGIPVTKRSVYKSYFSEAQMDSFKETLAKQNKLKKTNVEILQIYDKINIELFSAIKQDPGTKELICGQKAYYGSSKDLKMYYLVIGRRRDTKASIKTLALLEKNDN